MQYDYIKMCEWSVVTVAVAISKCNVKLHTYAKLKVELIELCVVRWPYSTLSKGLRVF